ncbi:hypothetical protein [Roseospira navarrensis]|uniref:Uncharacterized protein n=1 Tax=Roseospira navarrensis TaxID=140058 RepID=A0A7X1ZHM8_9PROT|nr:hypothetical protein [Roseospira navarrensis]MQX38149.1 hypothetical protein [Roseospira navarrensis]
MVGTNLTLYFGLPENEVAELEHVAAAAIEWVAAIRAAAATVSPDLEIVVGFEDAQRSSLKINTILNWAEDSLCQIERGSKRHTRLRFLAFSLCVFLVSAPTQYAIKAYPFASGAINIS